MRATENIAMTDSGGIGSGNAGIEQVRNPLSIAGVTVHPGGNKPAFQWAKILRLPFQRASEAGPGISASTPNSDPKDLARRITRAPQTARGNTLPDEFELRGWGSGQLSGSIISPSSDPEARGTLIEPVRQNSVLNQDNGVIYGPIPTEADTAGNTEPVLHFPEQGTADNIATLVQDPMGNAHHALRGIHGNFPYAGVYPLMRSRSRVLAGGVAQEIPLIDGTVAISIAWTAPATNDLIMSLDGLAALPVADTNNPALNDTLMVNPDTRKLFYAKGKRSASFFCANAVTVTVYCYLQES